MDRVSPAVIAAVAFDDEQNTLGFGSGFIVDSKGLIVSNYHVIQGAYSVAIKTIKGNVELVNGIVDYDSNKDYVILKINGFDLPIVPMGNSNNVNIGDEVVAIGNPKGLENTLTIGIISQKRVFQGNEMLQTQVPILEF